MKKELLIVSGILIVLLAVSLVLAVEITPTSTPTPTAEITPTPTAVPDGDTDDAEQDLEEDLEDEEIKVPGQKGYGWYKFKEKWKSFWIWNQQGKFKFKMKLAAKRAAELKFMIENNITKNLDIVTKLYNKTLEDIERKLEQWQEKGKNITLIEEKIENLTYKHYLVLQRVYDRAPLAARAGLMNAILTAKEHNLRMQIKILRRTNATDEEIANLTSRIGELRDIRKNIRDRMREEYKASRNQTGEGNETGDRDKNQTGNGKKNKSNL